MYDVIVLGKGPAGIQAAVYIKRANLNVLVIGKDGGALAKTDKVGNYYGFTQISGPELIRRRYKHAKALNIELIEEEVTGLVLGWSLLLRQHLIPTNLKQSSLRQDHLVHHLEFLILRS
jgi:thioredoxin reductase